MSAREQCPKAYREFSKAMNWAFLHGFGAGVGAGVIIGITLHLVGVY